jgi:hypothetical protein
LHFVEVEHFSKDKDGNDDDLDLRVGGGDEGGGENFCFFGVVVTAQL